MNSHRHWVLGLVDNDNAGKGIKDGAASRPGWQDRRQAIFPTFPVVPQCAQDDLISQDLILCADRCEKIVHPLQAGASELPQRDWEVVSGGFPIKISDESDQRFLVHTINLR